MSQHKFPACFVMPGNPNLEEVCLICGNLKCPTKINLVNESLLIDLPHELNIAEEPIDSFPNGAALDEYAQRIGIISLENSYCVQWDDLLNRLKEDWK